MSDQEIQRRKELLDRLVQQGDDLSAPRMISHLIYGHTSANRSRLEARLTAMGFEPDPNRPDIDPRALVFYRFAPLELDALNSDIDALSTLCAEFGCDYDGWEADFVKRAED